MKTLIHSTIAALVVATLALAGPVAGGLALTGHTVSQGLVDAAPESIDVRFPDSIQLVQETTTPVETPGPTGSQEIVLEWGNWVAVLLKPIQDIALSLLPLVALWVATLIPAWARLIFPARRINDLIENAVRSAIASVNGAVEGKKLSIPVTNNVVRQAVLYIIAQAPQLAKIAGDTLPLLVQKVLARLPQFADVPPTYTVDQAVKAVTEASIKKAASEQKVSTGPKDPFNQYFGT